MAAGQVGSLLRRRPGERLGKAGRSDMAHDVFISYSSKDKTIADAVCAKLEARGIRCWIAPRDILPSADWGASIIDAINGARAMVLVFSGNANLSTQIVREVERAANRAISIIPLRVENVAPVRSLEFFISSAHWLDAYTPPMDHHLGYLGDVILHLLEGKSAPEKPPPPPPPWWRGRLGLAAAGGALVLLAALAWFVFLRPPPGFAGNWTASALDIRQFATENALIASEIPSQMLAAAMQVPDAKGTLQIDPSGQFTLAISGTDRGTITASPANFTASGTSLTLTSNVTHSSFTVELSLFTIGQNGGGTGYDPANDPPPDGRTSFQMLFMPAGQSSGQPLADFTGTPNANGGMRVLDLIAGNWMPQQFSYMQNGGSTVSAALTLTADGHYTLTYSLRESGLWTASNGHWSRQIGSGGVAPSSTDSGTYRFSGGNQVSLYDQNGASTWLRGG
jgi:hypothetical protein